MDIETINAAAKRLEEKGFGDSDRMRLGGALAAAKAMHATLLSPVLAAPFKQVLSEQLHGQYWREMELFGLLQRVTPWRGDITVAYDLGLWNTNLSMLVPTFSLKPAFERDRARAIYGTLAIGHALLAELRPVPLIPPSADADDPFFSALRRVEVENARMMQAQLRMLHDAPIELGLDLKEQIVEATQKQVAELYSDLVKSMGNTGSSLS